MAFNPLNLQGHHPSPGTLDDFPMVSSLIDPETKWWKINAVRAFFLPFEADKILKIPLSHNLPKDKLIWIGNKRGEFKCLLHYCQTLKHYGRRGMLIQRPKCPALEKTLEIKAPYKI